MAESEWLMRVEKGMSAHFKQESGPSIPGVLWAVQLKQGPDIYTALVKVLLPDGVPQEVRSNQEYQAQVAMSYLNDRISNGWHPSNEVDHEISLGSPPPVNVTSSKSDKPWWRFW